MIITRTKAEEAHALLLSFYMGEVAGLPMEFSQLDTHVLQALFNSAARSTHPDMGGKPEDFVRVDHAKHVLLNWLDAPPKAPTAHTAEKCGHCEGRGYVQRQLGFKKGARVQCLKCHGSGDANYEADRTGEDR